METEPTAPPLTPPGRGLKYVSFCEASGYGEAASRYLAGLQQAGIPVTWTPLTWKPRGGYQPLTGPPPDSPFAALSNRPLDYDTVLVHTVPEYYPAWRQREPGKRLIGYTTWETDCPPDHWPPLLNSVDALLVPCAWNRDVFRRHGVTIPIHVVPHTASDRPLPARSPARYGLRPDDFCFYTINTWTTRKAVRDTITCFLNAFTAADPVALVVKTTRQDFTRRPWWRFRPLTRPVVQKLLASYPHPARVILIDREVRDDEMLALHAAGDCYLSLTRSEGWGIGAFDAATFGRPVIITGYGGQCDFLPAAHAWLLDYRLVPVRCDEGKPSYTENQNWAEPNQAQAVEFMRRAVADRPAAAARGAALHQFICERFRAPRITAQLLTAIGHREEACHAI